MQTCSPPPPPAAALRLPTGTGEHLGGGSAWAWLERQGLADAEPLPAPRRPDSRLRPPMLDGRAAPRPPHRHQPEHPRRRRTDRHPCTDSSSPRGGTAGRRPAAHPGKPRAPQPELLKTWTPSELSSTQRAWPPGMPRLAASSPRRRAGQGSGRRASTAPGGAACPRWRLLTPGRPSRRARLGPPAARTQPACRCTDQLRPTGLRLRRAAEQLRSHRRPSRTYHSKSASGSTTPPRRQPLAPEAVSVLYEVTLGFRPATGVAPGSPPSQPRSGNFPGSARWSPGRPEPTRAHRRWSCTAWPSARTQGRSGRKTDFCGSSRSSFSRA